MTQTERIDRLERKCAAVVAKCDELVAALNEQFQLIAELRTQLRFALNAMRMVRPGTGSPLLGPDGQPKIQLADGWEVYTRLGGRQKTLELLEAEQTMAIATHYAQELKAHGDERELSEILTEVVATIEAERTASQSDGEDGSESRADGADGRRSDPLDDAAAGAGDPRDAAARS